MPSRTRTKPQAPARSPVRPAPMAVPDTAASTCRFAEPGGGPTPQLALEAIAATVVVAAFAFGWATVMVATTGPLVAAVSLLARVVPYDDDAARRATDRAS
jgi:hypothetical protein